MTALDAARDWPEGRLDPLVRTHVTGWTTPGALVALTIDGSDFGKAPATEPRRFVTEAREEACGFSFDAPEVLFDGARHVIRVTAGGRDLPGSPLTFGLAGVSGRVDGLEGSVLHGVVRISKANEDPIVVAAMLGDETLAVGVARLVADGSDRHFALPLPTTALSGNRRLLQVGVAGSTAQLEGAPFVLPLQPSPQVQVIQRRKPVTLAIKISAPTLSQAHSWGDYHFANALRDSLQKLGWVVRVDCRDKWDQADDDVALALRGRHRYVGRPGAVNLLWVISHPDRMPADEPADYHHVFVASDIYASVLRSQTTSPVSVLHQATDPLVFHLPERRVAMTAPALFVGNSRREYRTMIRWCVEMGIDVAVFGSLWEGLIPHRLIKGEHIENTRLHQWYGSTPILLNDHWGTMLSEGFLSNRLFDGSAAGAFIITDRVRGLEAIFGDAIETASDAEELAAKVAHYIAHPSEAKEKAARARSIVLDSHTFDHRAQQIVATYEKLAVAHQNHY